MLLQVSVMAFVGIMMVAVARWLARSVFRSPIESLRIVHLTDADARQASRLTGLIGVTVGLEAGLEVVENDGIVVLAVSNLLSALLVLWGSGLVFRVARGIARRDRKPVATPGTRGGGRARSLAELPGHSAPWGRCTELAQVVRAAI